MVKWVRVTQEERNIDLILCKSPHSKCFLSIIPSNPHNCPVTMYLPILQMRKLRDGPHMKTFKEEAQFFLRIFIWTGMTYSLRWQRTSLRCDKTIQDANKCIVCLQWLNKHREEMPTEKMPMGKGCRMWLAFSSFLFTGSLQCCGHDTFYNKSQASINNQKTFTSRLQSCR